MRQHIAPTSCRERTYHNEILQSSGKADYRWAKAQAMKATTSSKGIMDPLFDFSGGRFGYRRQPGHGKQMSLAFAERGADIIVASRKLPACEEVAKEIEAKGRRALAYACHVGHWDELDGLVAAAYQKFGRVDVLINNAGLSPLYPSLEEISEELWDKVVALNLKGPFRLSALVGSRMAKGDGGSIINISSTASLNPSPTSEPYGAAKAGLNAITRSFAFACRKCASTVSSRDRFSRTSRKHGTWTPSRVPGAASGDEARR
jgi:hypothetical protein